MLKLRPLAALLGLVVVAVLAAGCGGSDPDAGSGSSASSSSRDAAQVKYRTCLRENGVDIPDSAGQGGGAGLRDVDQATLQKAQKACEELQQKAFGDISAEDRQQFQDAFAKFSSCMREHDVEVPDVGAGGGPPAGGNRLDQDDPKVKAATEACADQLPEGGRGGFGRQGGE